MGYLAKIKQYGFLQVIPTSLVQHRLSLLSELSRWDSCPKAGLERPVDTATSSSFVIAGWPAAGQGYTGWYFMLVSSLCKKTVARDNLCWQRKILGKALQIISLNERTLLALFIVQCEHITYFTIPADAREFFTVITTQTKNVRCVYFLYLRDADRDFGDGASKINASRRGMEYLTRGSVRGAK